MKAQNRNWFFDYIEGIFDFLSNHHRRLGPWERNFVESIKRRYRAGKYITEKQLKTLESIRDRVREW